SVGLTGNSGHVADNSPALRSLDGHEHFGLFFTDSVHWEPLGFVKKECTVFGNASKNCIVPVRLGIQDSGILHMQNRTSRELLTAHVEFNRGVQVELAETDGFPTNGGVGDAQSAIEIKDSKRLAVELCEGDLGRALKAVFFGL